jgi:hypothetical protein
VPSGSLCDFRILQFMANPLLNIPGWFTTQLLILLSKVLVDMVKIKLTSAKLQ